MIIVENLVFLKKRTKRPMKRRYLAFGTKELLITCENMKLVKEGVQVNWLELAEQYSRNAAMFDNPSYMAEEEEKMDVNDESQEESSDIESLDVEEEENIRQIGKLT